jgi:hypothetical protein
MNQAASPMDFQPAIVHTVPDATTRDMAPCCQQAVVHALECAGSMGFLATMTIMTMGFAVGLTTAWMLFG